MRKKAAALHLARQKAEERPHPEALPATKQSSPQEVSIGQNFGLVTEDSTLKKPSILRAGVQAFQPNDKVCLLW